MSAAPTKRALLSTPGSKGTASMSQAGHVASKVTVLYKDIAEDLVKKTTTRTFDQFLLYFLSLCLTGDAKATFEKLQSKIEILQHKRFTDASEEDASREEADLIEQRDNALKEHLNTLLQDVVNLANETGEIRSHLDNFVDALYEAEETRYEPWIKLSNEALKQLKTRDQSFLRKAAEYDLQTCRNDPRSVPTIVGGGEKKNADRKPDFVRTSNLAANHVHDKTQFHEKPRKTKHFVWSQVLSCEEMKMKHREPTKLAKAFANNKQYRFTAAPTPTIHDEKPDDSVNAETEKSVAEPSSISEISSFAETSSVAEPSSKVGDKRSHVDDVPSERSTKKARVSTAAKESTSTRSVSARVQIAQYALDMLSHSTGVKHVINTLIVDEWLWVWFYDRQGIIQSESINIIADFPRILVLLLLFQRFTIEDWGIIPCLNPQAKTRLGITGPVDTTKTTEFQLSLGSENFSQYLLNKGRPGMTPLPESQPITIRHRDYLSHPPYCIAGRATSVLEGNCREIKTAVKIYNPEVQRPHEGNILKLVENIAQKHDETMLDHLPRLYFSGDIKGCTTLRVRSMLRISAKGYRTTRVLVLGQLERLTTQKGDSFVKCWLQTVTCHAFLWKHGVEHGDPSLSNVLYDPAKKCGVLTDFDLSIIKCLPRVPGTERTGTVPYMAIDLLCQEYWDGKVTRHYYHELEAFLWIIPIVFHSPSEGGKLFPEDTVVEEWMTSDFKECGRSKGAYLTRFGQPFHPIQTGFKNHAAVVRGLGLTLFKQWTNSSSKRVEKAMMGEEWTEQDDLLLSKHMWGLLMTALRGMKLPVLEPFITKLDGLNPTAEKVTNKDPFSDLQKMYNTILTSTREAAATTG